MTSARYDIEVDTDRERALPLQVNERDGTISFWGSLGCSRNYHTDLGTALRAFLAEHGRKLVNVTGERIDEQPIMTQACTCSCPMGFHTATCASRAGAEPMFEGFDDLPDRIAELERLLESRYPDRPSSCGALYAASRRTRHRISVWCPGAAREFTGATFGEAYRPAYEYCRTDLGDAELASWIHIE